MPPARRLWDQVLRNHGEESGWTLLTQDLSDYSLDDSIVTTALLQGCPATHFSGQTYAHWHLAQLELEDKIIIITITGSLFHWLQIP